MEIENSGASIGAGHEIVVMAIEEAWDQSIS